MNRILLVEDDAIQLDALGILLEAKGLPSDRAENADAALARVAVYNYRALVVDMYMPGYTGLELVRRVREMPGRGGVPVVLLTAAADRAAGDLALRLAALGNAELVRKPCDADAVLAALYRLVTAAAAGTV